MIKSEDLIKWVENYDDIKYPSGIYNELIVEGMEHQNKISLMGAWKTGSLRVNENGNEYRDRNGFSYMFTNRWSTSTPVGFDVWTYINQNQKVIKNKIPKEFPLEKPEIAIDLQSRKGFGFIWTIFVLHCFYPKIYPLFDQHVYRAYKYIITEGKECPYLAPDKWTEYLNYKTYFSELLNNSKIHYWQLDRALWAYGKYLKQNSMIISKEKYSIKKKSLEHKNTILNSDDSNNWIHSTTLGGKAKSFWWKIDTNFAIHIKRKFKTFPSITSSVIRKEELEQIDDLMNSKEWVDLANNVEKLNNGTEKAGLGKFLYEVLNWQVVNAQLASHLSVIFTLSGAWEFNGLKRGMQFKKTNVDWKESIMTYYLNELSNDL